MTALLKPAIAFLQSIASVNLSCKYWTIAVLSQAISKGLSLCDRSLSFCLRLQFARVAIALIYKSSPNPSSFDSAKSQLLQLA
ncbi:hypothetical protein [Altericista sp. CCNU0014]|uniref:hypothetical protein n=1 Tax=Altericista sp. CCNU0014 TaxID=3082949 RepID=UPI003850865E